MNLVLTVPGAIALALLAAIPAWLLHLHGPARETFMIVLAIYSISIPFESINHLLLRAFYALKNTTVPALTSVVSTAAALASAYLLVDDLHLYALPVGYTVGQIVQSLQLWLQLRTTVKAQRMSLAEATVIEEGTL
jgi:peptidoglycan biosynthesis protein MviN/MurJ (putative lipid II flippase)